MFRMLALFFFLAGLHSWAECRCVRGLESFTHGQGNIQSKNNKPCTWMFNTKRDQVLRLSVTSKSLSYDDCWIGKCLKCAGSLTVGEDKVSCTSSDLPCFTYRSSASCPIDPNCKELTTSQIRVRLSPDYSEWEWEDYRFSMNYKYTDCPKGSHTTQKPTTLLTTFPKTTTKELPANQLNTTLAETSTLELTSPTTTLLSHRTTDTSSVSLTAQGAPRNCSDVKNCSNAKDGGKTVIIIAVVVCLLILVLLVVLGIALCRRRRGTKKQVLDNNSNPNEGGSSQCDEYAEVEEIGVHPSPSHVGAINPSYEDIYTAADEAPTNIASGSPSNNPSGRNESVVSIYSTVGRSNEPERSSKAKVTIRYKKFSDDKKIPVPEKTTEMVDNVLYGLTTENENDENYYAIEVGGKTNRSTTNGELVNNVLYTSLE